MSRISHPRLTGPRTDCYLFLSCLRSCGDCLYLVVSRDLEVSTELQQLPDPRTKMRWVYESSATDPPIRRRVSCAFAIYWLTENGYVEDLAEYDRLPSLVQQVISAHIAKEVS